VEDIKLKNKNLLYTKVIIIINKKL